MNSKKSTEAKVYIVAVGRDHGVYESWDACKEQVTGYSGSRFKSFTEQEDAMNYILHEMDTAPPYVFSTEKKKYVYNNREKYISHIRIYLRSKLGN